jgi:two-component system, chemotaxis family, response regulator Rcp1
MQVRADGTRPVEVLLVEDNPDDVRLTSEALREGKVANHLTVVRDGVEALRYMRREQPYAGADQPDLVLLDLNLPRKDGREVLAEMRRDPALQAIPVAIVTASTAEADQQEAKQLGALCYVTKPIDVAQMIQIVTLVQGFWLTVVSLPHGCVGGSTAMA